MSRELIGAINKVATDSIAAGRIPDHDENELPGVRALDLWRDGANGAMLFWVDAEADLHGWRERVVMDVLARYADGAWRVVAGASASSGPLDELAAELPPGLHRFGGSSADRVFLTWAVATPEVVMIRLREQS